jgi:hypothetical protein
VSEFPNADGWFDCSFCVDKNAEIERMKAEIKRLKAEAAALAAIVLEEELGYDPGYSGVPGSVENLISKLREAGVRYAKKG